MQQNKKNNFFIRENFNNKFVLKQALLLCYLVNNKKIEYHLFFKATAFDKNTDF